MEFAVIFIIVLISGVIANQNSIPMECIVETAVKSFPVALPFIALGFLYCCSIQIVRSVFSVSEGSVPCLTVSVDSSEPMPVLSRLFARLAPFSSEPMFPCLGHGVDTVAAELDDHIVAEDIASCFECKKGTGYVVGRDGDEGNARPRPHVLRILHAETGLRTQRTMGDESAEYQALMVHNSQALNFPKEAQFLFAHAASLARFSRRAKNERFDGANIFAAKRRLRLNGIMVCLDDMEMFRRIQHRIWTLQLHAIETEATV